MRIDIPHNPVSTLRIEVMEDHLESCRWSACWFYEHDANKYPLGEIWCEPKVGLSPNFHARIADDGRTASYQNFERCLAFLISPRGMT